MKRPNLIGLAAVTLSAALGLAAPSQAAEACWIEFSGGEAPGAMGAAGAKAQVWRNTASGLLVRHPQGHVLIDAGWSKAAAAQMAELGPKIRPFGEQVLAGLRWRVSAPEALAMAGETSAQLRYVVPTHLHYDHLAGAEDLPGPAILMAPAEIALAEQQLVKPDIVPASNIRAVRDRFQPIAFAERPYLGFAQSFDVFGDGAVVIVPLAGHTPGSVGVFVDVGGRKVFNIGDAAWVLEAVENGLPKIPQLRSVVDHDGPAADAQVQALRAFKQSHPEVAILPTHDRTAWEAVFGPEPRCVN